MIQLEQNITFAGRYKLVKQIGIGGYSEVWLAQDQMTANTEIALKVFVPEKGLDEIGIKQFSAEYAITQPLNHANLLKASHFDIVNGSPFLVMPYMQQGSLAKLLYAKGALSEDVIANIIKDMASSLSYLHNHNIVHQDIKPDNVLIDSEDNYRLTDFGISSKMRSTLHKHSTSKTAMTVAYAPPERFGKRPQTIAAGDVFSLAVMLYELTTGEVPWMGAGGVVLQNENQIPLLPEHYSQELIDLVESCMAIDPNDRPSTSDLENIANSYLQTGKWNVLSPANSSGNHRSESRKTVRTPPESGKTTIACHYCSAKLNIPSNKHIKVKCPKCETFLEFRNGQNIPYQFEKPKNTIEGQGEEETKIIKQYKAFLWFYLPSFVLVIIGIILMYSVEYDYEYDYYYKPYYELGVGILVMSFLTFITALIYGFIVLHSGWKSIQNSKTVFTTPGKAVGYLFIPYYNFYWIFMAYRKLFINMNEYSQSNKANVGFATFVCIIAVIPYVNLLNLIFMPILITQIKNNTINMLNLNK